MTAEKLDNFNFVQQCGNCKFWRMKKSKPNKDNSRKGYCLHDDSKTAINTWCGDFEEKIV